MHYQKSHDGYGTLLFETIWVSLVFPILANLYGPGDHLSSERAHVIADLMLRAKSSTDHLSVWGTGSAEREFLFVDDAVEGIVATLTRASLVVFTMLELGISTPIRELGSVDDSIINPILKLVFDRTKPDGQLKKVMNVSKMTQECGWTARTSFREGLERTWMWYSTHGGSVNATTFHSLLAICCWRFFNVGCLLGTCHW